MRILLAPVYNVPRPDTWEGDSCYLWALFMAREASARGWFTYWVMPDFFNPPAIPGVAYIKHPLADGPPKSDLFTRHGVPIEVVRMFPGACGTTFVDAVITNDVYLGMLYQQYLSARQFFETTPVVSWNGFLTILAHSEADWAFNGDDTPLYTRALGTALCNWVSCCPYCTGRTFELVQAFCPPQMVKRFLETRSEAMMCANCEMIDSLPKEKFERFSLYWGGRFTNTKGGEGSVQQYLRFVMGGRDADIYVTAIGGAKRLEEVLKKYGAKDLVKVFRGLPYEQAQAIMAKSHVSVFNQLNPGAAAPYEQMYAGLVVLFKRHHYPEEAQMYPPEYPFLFNTDDEGATMLRWIHEHYDEAVAQLEKVQVKQWVRDHTDKRLGANRILDHAVSRIQESSFGPATYKWHQDLQDTALKALEAMTPPVPFPLFLDAIDRVKGRPIVQRSWGMGINGIPPISIYRAFVPPGWRDDCTTEIPRLVRVDGGEHAG